MKNELASRTIYNTVEQSGLLYWQLVNINIINIFRSKARNTTIDIFSPTSCVYNSHGLDIRIKISSMGTEKRYLCTIFDFFLIPAAPSSHAGVRKSKF